nr:uncharacterized mitochondrial protein AtMg00810-like [Tanacetum cinerariifolium]
DEAPDFIIKFLKMIQVWLKVPVRRIRTDNETEFVNQTLREYYEQVVISHETLVAHSPQQNSGIKRRNCTLIEAARTIVDPPAPAVIAPIAEVAPVESTESTGSPSSTTVDQDVPSPSKSQTTPETQPPILPNDVEEDNHNIEVAHMCNDSFFGMPILEVVSDQSSSTDSTHAIVHPDHQISQSPKGIFINQSKYDFESLNKYDFKSCDPVDTPMVEKSKLDEDKEGKAVDPSHYHGMIGTLLYLTASRPNLQFAICMCARYQARPTEKHLHEVKRIFRDLRGTINRGLWYPKDSLMDLIAFADADHTDCQDTRCSTSGSL